MPRPFGINCLAIVGRGRGDMLPFDGNGPSLRLATVGRGRGDRLPFDGNGPSLRYMLSLRRLSIREPGGIDEVMPIQKAIQSCGEILCGMMGIEGLASRLLAVVAAIGCHLMETARPFEMLSIREVFASSDDHSPVTTPILPF
ncbi:uncharacterized protein G2W53_040033 [Senna tora]|uniref:Uncharacterized protein n=1 Tax=Senna tora TaxID=362788 RepID=A0A834SU96_9FABA|nr:uncharacterized protein G2W53_040033 [Senna tora]